MHWASVIFQIRGRYFQFLRDSKQKEHVPPPRMLLLVSQMPSTQMGQFARTSAKMARAAEGASEGGEQVSMCPGIPFAVGAGAGFLALPLLESDGRDRGALRSVPLQDRREGSDQ